RQIPPVRAERFCGPWTVGCAGDFGTPIHPPLQHFHRAINERLLLQPFSCCAYVRTAGNVRPHRPQEHSMHFALSVLLPRFSFKLGKLRTLAVDRGGSTVRLPLLGEWERWGGMSTFSPWRELRATGEA